MAKKQDKTKSKANPSSPQPTIRKTGPPSTFGQRSRLGKDRGVHISSPSHFGGHLTFTRAADQKRYENCCKRSIIPCKFIHFPTLDALKITDSVRDMFAAIGWSKYFTIQCPAFVELTREFYATFEFDLPHEYTVTTPNVVRFRLLGREFKQSLTDFNLAFGFIDRPYSESREYVDSICDYVEPFYSTNVGLWQELSVDKQRYDPSVSKSSFLKDPIWRYIQRFLAYSYSGRKDSSGTFAKPEFFFLWCMLNNLKVNLGCWLAQQFQFVLSRKSKPLILGSYITHLAVNLGVLDLSNHDLHLACPMEPLDLHCLEKMGVVERINGEFCFTPPGRPHTPAARSRAPGGPPRSTGSLGDIPETSTSAPSSTSWEAQLQHLHHQMGTIDDRLSRLELQVSHMAQNLAQYLHHVGFPPPFPPGP